MNRVEIKKGLFGGRSVGYDCPNCKARLTSPLDDAGKQDSCPDCGARFVVPGVEERDRIRGEKAAAAQQRKRQKESAKRKRQLQREEAERRALAARAPTSAPQSQTVEEETPIPPNDDAIHCPKCGSSQLTANKKGFGLGKAAVGGLLLGPVGLLGGAIGGGKIRITCLKCGNVFEPGQGR